VVSTDGASALPKAVAGNFLQLQELIKSTTGLDLTQIVSQLTDSSTVVVPADTTTPTTPTTNGTPGSAA
jgi:flotillin